MLDMELHFAAQLQTIMCVCVYIYIYIYVCMYVYTHTYIHTYIQVVYAMLDMELHSAAPFQTELSPGWSTQVFKSVASTLHPIP